MSERNTNNYKPLKELPIEIKIIDLLRAQEKSVYWLAKNSMISQYALGQIIKGKTTYIRFEVLANICNALKCDISDIIKIKS